MVVGDGSRKSAQSAATEAEASAASWIQPETKHEGYKVVVAVRAANLIQQLPALSGPVVSRRDG